MKAILAGSGIAVALCVVIGGAGGAAAQDLPACGRYPVGEATHTCICPAGAPMGSVWGSGPYTADSDMCTAARHAGTIGAEGGAVMAVRLDGMSEYAGSERNGVRTSRWGRYDTSIMMVPAPAVAAAPAAPAEPEITACGMLGPDVETRCTCEANGGNGSIWGAGPYTSDSDLCTAARHSGAIGLDGGEISLIRVPGLSSYRSVERNGIRSMEWGEYGESFIVNGNVQN